MKTETQVAEEGLELWRRTSGMGIFQKMSGHKHTCKRWLKFLNPHPNIFLGKFEVKEKIADLKQAIKLYSDMNI